jgi:GAF domain-containing protein
MHMNDNSTFDDFTGTYSLTMLLANDCEPDERLDLVTRDAATLFKVPIAMINLVTSDEIIFKSCIGLKQGDKLDRSGMFCSFAASQEEPLVVEEAIAHSFFRDCQLVTGTLGIRSYAGKSLHASDGSRIGTLCLFDTKSRTYSPEELEALCNLAEIADEQLQSLVRGSQFLSPSPL